MGNARRKPRWAAVLIGLVAVLAVAACGGDGGDEASGDTTERPETTDTTVAETTTTISPEAEIEAAIATYYAMVDRVVQAPDPDDPEIAQRAMGTNRETVESGFAQLAALGQYGRPGPNRSTTVLRATVSGDQANADVCEVDDGRLINSASGDVIDDDVVTRLVVISLERVDGAWLVSRVDPTDSSWEGVSDCA